MSLILHFQDHCDVRLIDAMGNDARIASAAWVSTSAEEGITKANAEPDKIPGLINYLMKHRHGTPFEHNAFTLFVRAPIFIWREWHRHRIGVSYNEESGRYKVLEPLFYLPHRERLMMKVEDWKPGRPKFTRCEVEHTYEKLCHGLSISYRLAYEIYLENLALGIDPGLARDCLPVGIFSSCWVTMNARSCMAFLSLRVHEPAAMFPSYPLAEMDAVARQVELIFSELFPITYAAFLKNGRVAP